MTYDEIVEAVLARAMDWDGEFPSSRLPMFRRIGMRQLQLFEQASNFNPDYYGRCAVCTIDPNGCCDLRTMALVATVDQSAGIQRVEIGDPGTNVVVVAGEKVHIVSVDDIAAALAPRVTLRDFIFRGVGTDITGVLTILVYYSRIPSQPLSSEDGTTALELLPQHQELLVIDLAKDLVKKTKKMDAEVKASLIADLGAEETEAMAFYLADIESFAGGSQERRFSEPPAQAGR